MKQLATALLLSFSVPSFGQLHRVNDDEREQVRQVVLKYVNESSDIKFRDRTMMVLTVFNVESPGVKSRFLLALLWDKSKTFFYEVFLTEDHQNNWKVFARGNETVDLLSPEGPEPLVKGVPTHYLQSGKIYRDNCVSHIRGL